MPCSDSTVLSFQLLVVTFLLGLGSGACKYNQYLNSTTSLCQKCSDQITGCGYCQEKPDLTLNCTKCDYRYFQFNDHNCTICSSLIGKGCQKCDNASGVFKCNECYSTHQKLSDDTCKRICHVSNCSNCPDSAMQCTQCSPQFYLLQNQTCIICRVIGCKNCSNNASQCTQCMQSFRLRTNLTCETCRVTDCQDCQNDVQKCNQCLSGFKLEDDDHCKRTCADSDCEDCPLNASVCTQCASGFNISNDACKRTCADSDCEDCPLNASVCTQCASGFNISNDACKRTCADSDCEDCPLNASVCTQCASGFNISNDACKRTCADSDCEDCPLNASVCTQCASGFNISNDACKRTCADSDCEDCPLNASVCTQCASGFNISNDACKRTCADSDCEDCPLNASVCTQCASGFNISNDACKRTCADSDCEDCPLNASVCTQCASGFNISNDACKRTCADSDCEDCPLNASVCTQCASGFNISNDACKRTCADSDCSVCSNNITQCAQCSLGFDLITPQRCQEICGDSYVINQECDLPLGVPNDGCTDHCSVQSGYQCQNYSIYPNKPSKSRCWFIGSQSTQFIQFLSSDKDSYFLENKIKMVFQINTKFPSCQSNEALKQLFTFSHPKVSIQEIGFNQDTLQLTIILGYSDDIDGKSYKLLFQPSAQINPAFLRSPQTYCEGTIQHNSPTLRVIAYSDGVYTITKFIMVFSIILCILGLATFFATLFSIKLAGLQIIFVIQYMCLTILWLPHYLPLPLLMITYLRFVNGYNILFVPSDNAAVTPHAFAFSLSDSSFASNYNLVFLFSAAPLLFVFSSKIAYHYASLEINKKKIKSRHELSLQLLMFGCLFNLQYFVSCFVMYLMGSNPLDPASLILIVLQLCIYVGTAGRFIYDSASFNRFKNRFVAPKLRENHYVFHFINLITSVLLLSLLPEYPWTPAIPQFLLLLYTLINTPYRTRQESYRSAFYILLMINMTAFKAYIWYEQPEPNSIQQYVWLILTQLSLFSGICWAIYELGDYFYHKRMAQRAHKDVKENQERQMMGDQRDIIPMEVASNDQREPFDILHESSNSDNSDRFMRQRQHYATNSRFNSQYIIYLSPIEYIEKEHYPNKESDQRSEEKGGMAKQEQGNTDKEQRFQLMAIRKRDKKDLQLKNAVCLQSTLKQYDNPLFSEDDDQNGKNIEMSELRSRSADGDEGEQTKEEMPRTPQVLEADQSGPMNSARGLLQ